MHKESNPFYSKKLSGTLSIALLTSLLTIPPASILVYITGSMVLLSELIRTIIETTAVIVSIIVFKLGQQLDDDIKIRKIESIANLVICLAMLVTLLAIFYMAYNRFEHPRQILHPTYGALYMSIPVLVNGFICYQNHQVEKQTNSALAHGQKKLFFTKFANNISVLLVLLALSIFPDVSWVYYLDPIGSLFTAVIISISLYQLFIKSFSELKSINKP